MNIFDDLPEKDNIERYIEFVNDLNSDQVALNSYANSQNKGKILNIIEKTPTCIIIRYTYYQSTFVHIDIHVDIKKRRMIRNSSFTVFRNEYNDTKKRYFKTLDDLYNHVQKIIIATYKSI